MNAKEHAEMALMAVDGAKKEAERGDQEQYAYCIETAIEHLATALLHQSLEAVR